MTEVEIVPEVAEVPAVGGSRKRRAIKVSVADDTDHGGNRATVALVYHAVGEVKELTRAGFTDVQRQLDALEDLPNAVGRLAEKQIHLDTRLADMDARVRKIENGETAVGEVLIQQFRRVESQVNDIERLGSRNAQSAERLAHELERKVQELTTEASKREALIKADQARIESNSRSIVLAVSLITAVNMLVNLAQLAGLLQ